MAQKLLIVDNNPDDIEITKIALAEIGYKDEVECARSGDAALQRLRGGDLPSLIFLDLKIPGISGIETLRQIRADERLRHVPVIIVSGSANPRDQKEVLKAGADGFLFKTFDFDALVREINSMLQRFLKGRQMPSI